MLDGRIGSLNFREVSDEYADNYRKNSKKLYKITAVTGIISAVGVGTGYLMYHLGGSEVTQLGNEVINYSIAALWGSGIVALWRMCLTPAKFIDDSSTTKNNKSLETLANTTKQ
jgi:zinc transporter ZupT